MPSSSLGVFRNKIMDGLSRPSQFYVSFRMPNQTNSDDIEFLCKSASLPASVSGMIAVPYRGRQIKIAGDRTFETWTITVLNSTDFNLRRKFESWMNVINNNRTTNGATNLSAYQVDINVYQLGKNNAVLQNYVLVGAFPVNVSAIELDYEQTDSISTFSVDFEYQYWENPHIEDTTDTFNDSATTAITGTVPGFGNPL